MFDKCIITVWHEYNLSNLWFVYAVQQVGGLGNKVQNHYSIYNKGI